MKKALIIMVLFLSANFTEATPLKNPKKELTEARLKIINLISTSPTAVDEIIASTLPIVHERLINFDKTVHCNPYALLII